MGWKGVSSGEGGLELRGGVGTDGCCCCGGGRLLLGVLHVLRAVEVAGSAAADTAEDVGGHVGLLVVV